MLEVKFKKSSAAIVFACLALCVLCVLPALIVLSDIVFWRTGQTFLKWDSRKTMIFVELFFLSSAFILFWQLIKNVSVRFTDEGIWQKTIRGWKFIAWKDVTDIKRISYGVHIHKGRESIVVAPAVYSDWNAVVSFISRRVSLAQK